MTLLTLEAVCFLIVYFFPFLCLLSLTICAGDEFEGFLLQICAAFDKEHAEYKAKIRKKV
jgi:hypothetical protein